MFRRFCTTVACLLLVSTAAWAEDKKPDSSAKGADAPAKAKAADAKAAEKAPAKSQDELDKELAEGLTDHVMVGNFTTNGAPPDQAVQDDRYSFGKVEKLPNGQWQFETHMQYGERDVKFKMAFPIKWAGDTPVISLTDLPIPGMGTFTARIMIYRGQYAGTWSAGDHGGLMAGKILKASEAPPLDKNAKPRPGGGFF